MNNWCDVDEDRVRSTVKVEATFIGQSRCTESVCIMCRLTFFHLVSGLKMANGRKYYVEVTAINGAGLANPHTSHGVIVDTTPPVVKAVSIIRGTLLTCIYILRFVT